MIRIIAAFLVALMLFTPSLALGQEYSRFRLPAGHRCTVAAETYQCFDLGEYTELLHIDEDLRRLTDLHIVDLSRIEALTEAVESRRLALEAADTAINTLSLERARLTVLWEEENRLRHEAENQPDWSWIPWTLAAAFAIVAVVLAVIIGVRE